MRFFRALIVVSAVLLIQAAQARDLTTAEIKSFVKVLEGKILLQNLPEGTGTSADGKPFAFEVKRIGGGGFGDVFSIHFASDHNSGAIAAKVIRQSKETRSNLPKVKKAIDNLTTFQGNDHFLKYMGALEDTENDFAILTELGGDNLDTLYIVQQTQPLSFGVLFHQMADGVLYMHELGYGHFDLKPANMVLGLDGKVKIIDTDGATNVEKRTKKPPSSPSTRGYKAPELCNGGFQKKDIDWREADVYALGMSFLSLLQKKHLQSLLIGAIPPLTEAAKREKEGRMSSEDFKKAFNNFCTDGTFAGALRGSYLNNRSSIFRLIIKMLEADPTKRVNINQVIDELDTIYPQKKL